MLANRSWSPGGVHEVSLRKSLTQFEAHLRRRGKAAREPGSLKSKRAGPGKGGSGARPREGPSAGIRRVGQKGRAP